MRFIAKNKIPIIVSAHLVHLIYFIISYVEYNLASHYIGYDLLYSVCLPVVLSLFARYDDWKQRKQRLRCAIIYFIIEALVLPTYYVYLTYALYRGQMMEYYGGVRLALTILKPVVYGILLVIYANRRKQKNNTWFYVALAECAVFSIVEFIQHPTISLYTLTYLIGMFEYVPAFACKNSKEKVSTVDSAYAYLDMYKNNMKN